MRKHVQPTHPQAAIPDPVRGGDLPPEGLTVEWSVHWARLAQRGDVIATDVDEAAKAPLVFADEADPWPTKPDVPADAPIGDAPAESGPQVEAPEVAPPASPATNEPSII